MLLPFEPSHKPGFAIGPAQIQSITDVSRGSVKRKKPSGSPSLNNLCLPEDEVATATERAVVANHVATGPTIHHPILSSHHKQSITPVMFKSTFGALYASALKIARAY